MQSQHVQVKAGGRLLPQMSGERPHDTPDNIEATAAVSHFCCGIFIVRVLDHIVSNPREAHTITREPVGAACGVG